MKFKVWLEAEKQIKTINSATLSPEDQYQLGHAAIINNDGTLTGYHVTDDVDKLKKISQSSKEITATFRKGMGKYTELGPGLYVSAVPDFWLNRSTGKWDFLKTLTPRQKQKLADALRNHPNITGEYINGQLYRYVSKSEAENANRYIDEWLQLNHDPILVFLAGQPYNIGFWKPEFLKPLDIEPAPPPKVVKVNFAGEFIDLRNDVGNWTAIANAIRQGYDGGFNPGGFVGNPELCIWKKKSIKSISQETATNG